MARIAAQRVDVEAKDALSSARVRHNGVLARLLGVGLVERAQLDLERAQLAQHFVALEQKRF